MNVLDEIDEELGSAGLVEFCSAQKDLLVADVLVASDCLRLLDDVPAVFLGSKGALNFE